MIKLELTEVLNDGNTHHYSALISDETVGFCQIRLKPSSSQEYPTECASHMYYQVCEPFRGQGLGGKLFEAALDQAHQLGLKNILVSCQDNNPASKHIIESAGCEYINTYSAKDSGPQLHMYSYTQKLR